MEHTRKPYDPTQLAEDFSTLLDRVPALASLYRTPDVAIEDVRVLGVAYANGIPVTKKTLPSDIEQPRITRKIVTLLLSSGLEETVKYVSEVTERVERNNRENREIALVFSESTLPGVQIHGHNATTGEFYEIIPSGKKPILPDCDGRLPEPYYQGINN